MTLSAHVYIPDNTVDEIAANYLDKKKYPDIFAAAAEDELGDLLDLKASTAKLCEELHEELRGVRVSWDAIVRVTTSITKAYSLLTVDLFPEPYEDNREIDDVDNKQEWIEDYLKESLPRLVEKCLVFKGARKL